LEFVGFNSFVIIEPRNVKLTTRTGVEVRRSVPHARLRRIGAWCFVDHFGPTKQTDGMVVAAHPHTGLQTVTWVFEGAFDHRDSIGSVQAIAPGQLNLMTAGIGISHSELSISSSENLHAVQLWIALPDEHRNQEPFFEHQANLPILELDGYSAKLLVGEFQGAKAPTKVFSELVGVELRIPRGESIRLPLQPHFEYGLLIAKGEVLAGVEELERVATNNLAFWPTGNTDLVVSAGDQDVIAILLGGVPMHEKILMWWNFIARDHQEIVQVREAWNSRDARFGSFEDDIGGWIPAPELPNLILQPR
jgi:quercetin 2,3-dioxygenase